MIKAKGKPSKQKRDGVSVADKPEVRAAARRLQSETDARAGTIRLIFPTDLVMTERIEGYRAKHGLRSTSAAIRALIERGLKP